MTTGKRYMAVLFKVTKDADRPGKVKFTENTSVARVHGDSVDEVLDAIMDATREYVYGFCRKNQYTEIRIRVGDFQDPEYPQGVWVHTRRGICGVNSKSASVPVESKTWFKWSHVSND